MSALAGKINGYQNATRAAGNPRDVEYQLFALITGRLNRATTPGRPHAELAAAYVSSKARKADKIHLPKNFLVDIGNSF